MNCCCCWLIWFRIDGHEQARGLYVERGVHRGGYDDSLVFNSIPWLDPALFSFCAECCVQPHNPELAMTSGHPTGQSAHGICSRAQDRARTSRSAVAKLVGTLEIILLWLSAPDPAGALVSRRIFSRDMCKEARVGARQSKATAGPLHRSCSSFRGVRYVCGQLINVKNNW